MRTMSRMVCSRALLRGVDAVSSMVAIVTHVEAVVAKVSTALALRPWVVHAERNESTALFPSNQEIP